jgi:co-chaperonin GroES (HSP10)
VPRDAQKRALIGKVLHVGPEVIDIKPDQMVLFAQFSGCSPYMNTDLQKTYGEDILIMNDEDILSFVVEEPAAVEAVA